VKTRRAWLRSDSGTVPAAGKMIVPVARSGTAAPRPADLVDAQSHAPVRTGPGWRCGSQHQDAIGHSGDGGRSVAVMAARESPREGRVRQGGARASSGRAERGHQARTARKDRAARRRRGAGRLSPHPGGLPGQADPTVAPPGALLSAANDLHAVCTPPSRQLQPAPAWRDQPAHGQPAAWQGGLAAVCCKADSIWPSQQAYRDFMPPGFYGRTPEEPGSAAHARGGDAELPLQ
jgi:hypothetical protein